MQFEPPFFIWRKENDIYMNIDLIIKIIITIICIVFTYVIVPLIKQKTGEVKFAKLCDYVEYAVRAMEQTTKTNEEKKEIVYNYILSKSNEFGLGMKEDDVDQLVEGIVNLVKHGGE